MRLPKGTGAPQGPGGKTPDSSKAARGTCGPAKSGAGWCRRLGTESRRNGVFRPLRPEISLRRGDGATHFCSDATRIELKQSLRVSHIMQAKCTHVALQTSPAKDHTCIFWHRGMEVNSTTGEMCTDHGSTNMTRGPRAHAMYKVLSRLWGTTYNGPEGGSTTQLISGGTKCKPFCGTKCGVRCLRGANPTKHKVYFTHPPCRRLSGPPCSDGRPNPSTRGMPASCSGQCPIIERSRTSCWKKLRAQRTHR